MRSAMVKRVRTCAGVSLLWAVGLASAALGAEYPSADGGVLTLTETGEYADAVPDGVTKLVIDASGEVTLSSSTAFTGEVEVRAGSTLKVASFDLLANAPVTVNDGATLCPTFEGRGQSARALLKPITISGTGADGKGAFRYAGPGKVFADSLVSTLVLAADATIDCSVRWGVASGGLIDLDGHTLTRIGTSVFIFYGATMTPGTFKNTAGSLTFQDGPFGVAEGHAGDETLVHLTGGSLGFWNAKYPVPYKVRRTAGNVEAGSGLGPNVNLISGPVEIETEMTIEPGWMADGKASYGFMGPLTISSGKLWLKHSGTLYLGGPITGVLWASDFGLISVTAADAGTPQFIMKNGRFALDVDRVRASMFRCANYGGDFGAFHHKRGDMTCAYWDNPRIGEGKGTFGMYTLDAGGFYPENSVYLADGAGSRGFFLQRGGRVELRADAQNDNTGMHLRIAGCDAQACFVQTGGTNDLLSAYVGSGVKWRTQFGVFGATNLLFALSGTGTVYRTDGFAFGCATNRTTGVIAVNDGASLAARRFMATTASPAEGTDVTLSLDGGVLCPLFAYGWGNADASSGKNVPQHVIVGPKGAVIDTSASVDTAGRFGISSDIPLTFKAPEGQGIASIDVPEAAADVAYYGGVAVEIEGPAGSYGASAYGDWDETKNRLKRIVVTSAGCNYDETTKVYVRGPTTRGETRYECAYALTGAQASGPLVKRGANRVTLYGQNTCAGGTIVEAGSLFLRGAGTVLANTPLKVMDGATFDNGGRALVVSTLSGAGGAVTNCASSLTVTGALEITAAELFAASGSLTVEGAVTFGDGAVVRVTDPENLPALQPERSRPFLRATGGFAGTVPTLKLEDATGRGWKVFRSGKTLRFGPERGACMVIR